MFPYEWQIKDGYPAKGVEKHGHTVMTTFSCGGGSSMGYKLAGYNVIAANDIDPDMQKVYLANHDVDNYYLCSVKDLLSNNDLPKVDVLDGSPPCSTFSMTGLREDAWQREKHFREGQAVQVLDDLFFDFIDLVGKTQPKIVIAENVKGMLHGNAKGYVKEIVKRLSDIGYKCQVFLLNSATMGVPQGRERTFFVAHKGNKKVNLEFDQKQIFFKEVSDDSDTKENLTDLFKGYWYKTEPGDSLGSFGVQRKQRLDRVAYTMTSRNRTYHPCYVRTLNNNEIMKIGSWPEDYDFCGLDPQYIVGMSVPPVMMAQVSYQIYKQLLK